MDPEPDPNPDFPPAPTFEPYDLDLGGRGIYRVLEPALPTAHRLQEPGGQVVVVPCADSGEALTVEGLAEMLEHPPGALEAAKAAKAQRIDAEARALVAAGATLTGAQYGPANGLSFGIADHDRLNWDQLNAMLEKAAKLGASSGTLVEAVLGAPILALDGRPVFGMALVNYDHFLLGVGAAYGGIWGVRATRLAALAEATTLEEVAAA